MEQVIKIFIGIKKNILGRNNYFKVDTGAETNLIPNNIWILIPNRPKLMPINTKL
jgi:hypothetical protein